MKQSIVLLSAMMLLVVACKKEEQAIPSMTAQAVFGTVTLAGAGGERALKVGDTIAASDTVTTGEKSMADLLYGSAGLVRISENSKLVFKDLLSEKNADTKLFMERGRLFVSLSKLKKGSFSIKTHTILASVRGTSFRVIAEKGEYIGKVDMINKTTGEIIVRAPNAAARIKMMDRLHVFFGEEAAVMEAVFPMQTIAKCRLTKQFAPKLGSLYKGMAVYRGDSKATKLDVLNGTVRVNAVSQEKEGEKAVEVTTNQTITVDEAKAVAAVQEKKELAAVDLHPDDIKDIAGEMKEVAPAIIEKLDEGLRKEIKEKVIENPQAIEEKAPQEQPVAPKATIKKQAQKETQTVDTKAAEEKTPVVEEQKIDPDQPLNQEPKKKKKAAAPINL